jgi:hypothetical protein
MSKAVPQPALVLGYAGLIPFLGLSFGPVLGVIDKATAQPMLMAYTAVIQSFMGGIQWGLAMGRDQVTYPRLGFSVVPALIAWVALLIGGTVGLLIVAATFALILFYDLELVGAGVASPWYPRLRWPLTIIVIACLLLAALIG